MSVDHITFFKSYFDSVENLDPEVYKECLNAMFRYIFRDEEPSGLSPYANMFWTLVKPTIDKSLSKASNGGKGGKADSKQTSTPEEANQKQTRSKPEANQKQTDTDKEGDKEVGERNKDKGLKEGGYSDNWQSTPPTTPANLMLDHTQGIADQFADPRMGQEMEKWIDVRKRLPRPFYPSAVSSTLDMAKKYEEKYGAAACIDLIEACIAKGSDEIYWDRLDRQKARSGTTSAYMDAIKNRVDVVDSWTVT